MKTAFVDVDTQLDFLYPAGALYVPGAERIVPAVRDLNRFAAAHGIPLISTADAHAEDDPEFRQWPPHCIAGTWGQRKAEATLLEPGARQIIAEKQTVDVGRAPEFLRAVEGLGAERFVVYGVVTEICVLFAARGLLKMGREVTIVTDAVKELSANAGRQALEELCSGGARLATTREVLAG
jgi:nicotinamidase/pyrazinamidase